MNYVQEHFTFKNLGLYICLSAGIRIGEICALTWEDIDTDTGIIHIRKTIQRIYIIEEGSRHTELILDSPKTKNSIRDIPMSRDLLRMLKPIKKVVNNSFYVLTNDRKPTEPITFKRLMRELDNEVPKGMPKERGQNSIADMMTRFRAFYLWTIDNDYTTNNPFKRYTVSEIVYGTPIYISNEERKRLYETDLSDSLVLATQRDIFVFQCLIGCRVSDLMKMTHKNIIDEAIEYIPRKTKEDRPITVRVPLNPTALDIVARFKDPNREALFPFYTEQKYNVKIKEAFKRAGLDRMVTTIDQRTRQEVQRSLYEVASSHMARRSFIGNIYKKVKDPNLVGSLSGHKEGSKAFARYRTIDDDMKKELVGMLD